jgi:hypothetical protein
MTVIGRREDCDLRIPLGDISRKHARLVRDGDTLRLEDLGSSNGTYLNGQRVQEAALNPGDTVQIGPVVFVLQIDGYPVDDDLQPVVAETAAHVAPEPAESETSPLSPTAQSEVEDHGHMDELSSLEDAAEGLEELPPLEEEAHEIPAPAPRAKAAPPPMPPPMPPKAAAPKPPAPVKSAPAKNVDPAPLPLDDVGDIELLPEEQETLDLLPDDDAPLAHDEPLDLDMGVDSHPHPHA